MSTKAKIIVRTRRKVFEGIGYKLAEELEIPHSASNQEIFSIIRQYLDNCTRELKGRYIDTQHLETIGPHIDWRSLLG